ncbi:hypothetical protein [Streptomyces paludis]|uniref:Uncharacterized protein n=1 Tax=Streptomyces paludis TaxID=2282738 RepID=A0A345HIZ8_9ACTN|nr:hypothetical protein [Streptomyces paludis]AXG76672.1 hypothetical protein DVK44_02125 [Streptomyces paludis]
MALPGHEAGRPGRAAERFVAASAVLTGFDTAELAETGMAESYREFVTRCAEPPLYAELLDRLTGPAADARAALAEDESLAELARAVCHLWYVGEWPGLAADEGGPAPRLLSGRAYSRGLVWRGLGGHAPGAGRPGYGTWAAPPATAAAAGGGVR